MCCKTQLDSVHIVTAIGALERFDAFTRVPSPSTRDNTDFIKTTLVLVDGMTHTQRSLCSKFIFKQFIELYVSTELLSTYHLGFNPNIPCRDYQKDKKCETCELRSVLAEFHLGYVMIFCAETICNEIERISQYKLKQLMHSYFKRDGRNLKQNKFAIHRRLRRLLLSKGIAKLQDYGRKYIENAFTFVCAQRNYKAFCEDDERKDSIFFGPNLSCSIPHILGRLYFEMDKNLDTANQYFVISACINSSLYEKVLSLRALSDCCFANGQYLIAKKILNAVYVLCNGYFLPSFVEKEYKIKMRKCKEEIKMLCCGYCGKYKALRSCTGCFKVSYCSNKCQKSDWNKRHRNKCSGYWHSDGKYFYKLLKVVIFDPIFQ